MKYIHFLKVFHLCLENSTKQLISTKTLIIDNNTVDKLKVKLQLLDLSLKEQAKHKQNIIQNIFYKNAELLKLNYSHANNIIA